MPAVDVSVLSAADITGVSLSKSFCVYVRLQGQAIRTKAADTDREGVVRFGERFRFQYRPDAHRSGRNRLFAELWVKSLFSQDCLSVAWIEMEEQHFVRGQPLRVTLRGTFKGKGAAVTLTITPLDFGEVPPPQLPPHQAYQPHQQQQLYQQYFQEQQRQQQQFYQPQPQPMRPNETVEGVPLVPTNPYTSAAYTTNTEPVVPEPAHCGRCEAAPLPPQLPVFDTASLPPPLYPGLTLETHGPSTAQNGHPEALPAPLTTAPNKLGGGDYERPTPL